MLEAYIIALLIDLSTTVFDLSVVVDIYSVCGKI